MDAGVRHFYTVVRLAEKRGLSGKWESGILYGLSNGEKRTVKEVGVGHSYTVFRLAELMLDNHCNVICLYTQKAILCRICITNRIVSSFKTSPIISINNVHGLFLSM